MGLRDGGVLPSVMAILRWQLCACMSIPKATHCCAPLDVRSSLVLNEAEQVVELARQVYLFLFYLLGLSNVGWLGMHYPDIMLLLCHVYNMRILW